ncbi:MAG: 30S ribosome-binding factor RbfA [Candidatus Sericytochromatia bacterium]
MANSIRVEKVTAEIHRALSDILRSEVHDIRITEHFGSITRVDLTRDLSHATIYVSVFGEPEDQQDFMQGLTSAKGFIRSELGRRVRLRFTPELHFRLDLALEKGAKVISLIEKLRAEGQL